MTKIRRAVRAVLALLVLLAAVVGAPIALWTAGRDLLPARRPSLDELWSTLFTRDTGEVFIGTLAAVGLVAWAVFSVCVAVELAARLTRRRPARPIRGLRLPQSAASALVGAILSGSLLAGVGPVAAVDLHSTLTDTVAAATASAVSAPAGAAAPRSARPSTVASTTSAAVDKPSLTGPGWQVQRYDTFWRIAEQTLGDGRRFPEIVAVNLGVPQADGRTVVDAHTDLEIGWVLRLPAGAQLPAAAAPPPTLDPPASVTLERGDTLSQVALDTLGDATRYPELAAANGIADPNVIEAGDVIVIAPVPASVPVGQEATPLSPPVGELPPPVQGGGADPGDPATPPLDVPASAPALTPPVGQNPVDGELEPAAPGAPSTFTAAPSATTQSEPVEQTPAAPFGTTVSPAGSEPAAPSVSTDDADSTGQQLLVAAGIGSVLAAATWLALLAARRRNIRRRPLGQQPAPVSLSAARTELQLRKGARAVDVLWMDRALRCVAALCGDRAAADLPDVTCVWLSAHEVQLQLAVSVPAPPPFVGDGDSWSLPVDVPLPGPEIWTEAAAPFPALASLGEFDGGNLLVDLERLGSVALVGDPSRTRALLNHLAVEFAHQAWSDHLEVVLVGWGAELVVLNPDRIRHIPTGAQAAAALRGRAAAAHDLQQESGLSVLAGRITDPGEDDVWTPQVLLVDAAAAGDLAEVTAELTGTTRRAVAVVACGAPAAAGTTVITVDADGSLGVPAVLGAQRVMAAGLDDAALQRVLELFEATSRFTPPQAALGTEPWAAGMNQAGSLVIEAPAGSDRAQNDAAGAAADEATGPPAAAAAAVPGDQLDADHGKPSNRVQAAGGDADEQPGRVGQEPAGQPAVRDPEPARVLVFPVGSSAAARSVLAATVAADSRLDEDLAQWHAEGTRAPRIGVLGPPLVVASGQQPTMRVNRFTELCVYLAVHKEVDADKFLTDLWPDGAQVSAVTRRSDISRCRRWLGVDEDGQFHLPEARRKPYRLTRLLDVELFRRLRKRAEARDRAADPDGAQRDLLAALMLVRGPVLSEATRDSYGWLATSDPMGLRQSSLMVIEAGHQLVDLALADGDLDLARIAADVAHQVDPSEDLPLCDLLRIAYRGGDVVGARMWARRLLDTNGVERAEDLMNHDSFLVVDEVFPHGLRAAAASS